MSTEGAPLPLHEQKMLQLQGLMAEVTHERPIFTDVSGRPLITDSTAHRRQVAQAYGEALLEFDPNADVRGIAAEINSFFSDPQSPLPLTDFMVHGKRIRGLDPSEITPEAAVRISITRALGKQISQRADKALAHEEEMREVGFVRKRVNNINIYFLAEEYKGKRSPRRTVVITEAQRAPTAIELTQRLPSGLVIPLIHRDIDCNDPSVTEQGGLYPENVGVLLKLNANSSTSGRESIPYIPMWEEIVRLQSLFAPLVINEEKKEEQRLKPGKDYIPGGPDDPRREDYNALTNYLRF